ncbi:flagellar M-ring protein FliF [Couchioplanes caeruleus]|uniref:flagellar basal-body MS-ring/collar protein FliF n=1 Tax=Couchioplanes caeruleus TaxID=56438 RepID=UPI00201C0BC0|nr:flagellar basal-body MS-ring/collar protein FliF [Couchioplanes caeruleus]UQU65425.1 flagellar M-ring protein FliF [Couchioplanes caeruleus]
MTDRLPAPVRKVGDTFKSFTPGQKAVTIAAVLALVIGGYFFATWASKPSYSALFSNLSSKDASAIVESLQKSGTPYELANGGTTIMVPQDQVYDLRLQMSGEGLPGDADTGYALLDKQGITTSDFMQHTNYQRALQGELANTIKSIDGVEAATVNLVIPQKDVFADDQEKTTASVLVASSPSKPLSGQTVQAIVNLVASSVEGLDPTNVTVVGADGKVLSSGNGAPVSSGGDSGSDSETVAFQNRLNSSLQKMLDAVVGPGHAVVTTTAELDFDRTQTTSKTYSSDPSVAALSEQIQREAYNGNGNGTGGVLGPDNIQVPNGTSSAGTGQYENSTVTRNNSVNEVTETRNRAPGSIKRLNVAVLLDATTAGAVNQADVQTLVSAAAGVDPTRGDTVAVSAMAFDTSAATAAQNALAASAAAEKSAKQTSLIKTAAMALVVLFLIFLAWRWSRKQRKRKALTPAELRHLEEMQAALEAQRLAELNAAIPSPALEAANITHEALEERQREIEQMVEDQPEEMAALLRGWLGAGR